jgi:hypothetical protein
MAYLFHVINICGSLIEEYPGVQVRKTQVCFLRQNVRLLYTTHLFIPNAMKLNAQPNAPLFLQIICWVILGLFKEAFQCCTIVSWNGNFTSEWFEIGVMGNRKYPLVFFFLRYFLICQYICGGVESKSGISRSVYLASWPTFWMRLHICITYADEICNERSKKKSDQ